MIFSLNEYARMMLLQDIMFYKKIKKAYRSPPKLKIPQKMSQNQHFNQEEHIFLTLLFYNNMLKKYLAMTY